MRWRKWRQSMSKKSSEHVVLQGDGPQGGALCMRCGAKLAVQLPCRVDDWCDAMRKFEARHRDCREAEKQ